MWEAWDTSGRAMPRRVPPEAWDSACPACPRETEEKALGMRSRAPRRHRTHLAVCGSSDPTAPRAFCTDTAICSCVAQGLWL